MHNLDQHNAASTQRAALECAAINADLERLKAMLAEAGDRLAASFSAVGTLARLPARNDEEQRRLSGAIATAVVALQFQDLANQLTSHAQRRLTALEETLTEIANGVDPLLATTRLQPVRQLGMGAGSIDLF